MTLFELHIFHIIYMQCPPVVKEAPWEKFVCVIPLHLLLCADKTHSVLETFLFVLLKP